MIVVPSSISSMRETLAVYVVLAGIAVLRMFYASPVDQLNSGT